VTQLTIKRLLTKKDSLGETKTDAISVTLGPKDVVLKVDQAAITTNNITYAAFGDAMDYWQFFPTHLEDWGHMPVWGFADVVHSELDGIDVGERIYGYFPLASHLVVQPVRISERGFYDGSEHRLGLTSAYNQYTRSTTEVDPGYRVDKEMYQSLVRPLFITSYMLADFLVDNNAFDAHQLVVSSASSKTAYGTAYCLKKSNPELNLIALTSSKNVAFVEGLGCYDAVMSYDDYTDISADIPTTYVDFSGNEGLRERLHIHFGDYLVYDCFAGSAQHTEFLKDLGFPGPKPIMFFAPIQIKKRNKDFGGPEVTRKFSAAQNEFISHLADAKPAWMDIQEHAGFTATQKLITALHSGEVDPHIGNIVRLAG